MKFLERVLTAVACLIVAATSGLPNKYLPPNFGAVGVRDSSQLPPYHAGSSGASRVIPRVLQQYSTAVSAPTHAASHFGHNRAAARVPILRNEYNNDGSGNYKFGFETGNGIKRDESGHFQGSWPGGSLKVTGSYSYTGDDGKLYSISYEADSNGFRAEGDHLPTPPPIPREIQETLHLHQHGSNQRDSAASYTSGFSNGSPRNFAPGFIPSASYLPPRHTQGYNYDIHN